MKAIEFQWHIIFCQAQYLSTVTCVYHHFYSLKSCKLLQVSINHVVLLQVATVFVNTQMLKNHDCFSPT